MTISIIVPTYNEADNILALISHLKTHAGDKTELLVVDGGSEDQTVAKVRQAGIHCLESPKGRAKQMNFGAQKTTGDILYFVHADSFPPLNFTTAIKKAIGQDYPAGCFRFQFDSDHPLLKINSYCTRFDRIMCRGGDQTLFITRALFDKLGGYRDDYIIMEDYDLIQRIQQATSFKIIPDDVIVSPRKYENNGYLKVQVANFIVFMMYFWGCSQHKMCRFYKRMLSLSNS